MRDIDAFSRSRGYHEGWWDAIDRNDENCTEARWEGVRLGVLAALAVALAAWLWGKR